MTAGRSPKERSSTSRPRPSPRSSRSGEASSRSGSTGSDPSPVLGAGALRELARRHGIRPSKALGQNFLIDPNLARAIAADAEVGPGDRVVEIGAGFGSLTVALAVTGAEVLAVEFDRGLVPALRETTAGLARVRVVQTDAMTADWGELLGPAVDGSWTLVANLPYNIATPLVLDLLADVPAIGRMFVMVQREVGERLAAAAATEPYGAVSVRVAFRASARVIRRVPAAVFWPRPTVSSVIIRLERLASPPVEADPESLWRVVEAGFAERRKTMRNALRRLGAQGEVAAEVLAACGVAPSARAEELDLETFACLSRAMADRGLA
jgi:16S rRNA (adenine1518-N6/adenine1519-N6)-dimethyltransferase